MDLRENFRTALRALSANKLRSSLTMLGILLGWGLGQVVTLTGVVTVITTWESIAMAVGFATAIGVFFGLYPADRASRLKPIQVLRSE